MIEAPHYSAAGALKKGTFALPGDYFDGAVNQPVLHEAVKVFLNNQRQGTHQTKTRSFVSGGNQKPWKQKGTGRARQGSTRAPHWRGGGIVFGPSPRDYRTGMPRKVRQLARRSALNARAANGSLYVVEPLAMTAPRTSQLVELLEKLGIADRKVVILTHGIHEAAYLSSRNLPNAQVMPYAEASAYDVLWSDVVVVEEGALNGEPLPPVRSFTPTPKSPAPELKAERAPRAAKPKAEKPKAEKPKAEKPKAEKKPAARAGKPKSSKRAAPKAEKKTASTRRKTSAAAKKPAPKKKGGQ
jgi:large subunit ribosomal protein L4